MTYIQKLSYQGEVVGRDSSVYQIPIIDKSKGDKHLGHMIFRTGLSSIYADIESDFEFHFKISESSDISENRLLHPIQTALDIDTTKHRIYRESLFMAWAIAWYLVKESAESDEFEVVFDPRGKEF